MLEPVAQLLRRQLQDGLPDLDGAEATATIPISDRLLSQAIVAGIPSGAPVKDASLRAGENDRIALKITLARPSFLPPIPVSLAIHEQPTLPANPTLTLRLSQSAALVAMAERRWRHAPLPAGGEHRRRSHRRGPPHAAGDARYRAPFPFLTASRTFDSTAGRVALSPRRGSPASVAVSLLRRR